MNLSNYHIDKNSKTPLYLQVEDVISDILRQEPYSLGEKLPNELEISEKLSISRNTVRKAMDNLLNKNLIVRKKNRGTFKNIDNERMRTTLNNWYSFNDEMKKQNREFKMFEHIVSKCKPSFEVCDRLDINTNLQIIKLLRIKGYLEPELYVESYFHPDLNLKIEELQDTEIYQLYPFLEKKLDIKIVFSQEDILASMPSPQIKKALNIIDEKTPVIIKKMLIYDKNNRKIAYSIGYYLANRFVFNLNISR